MSFVFAIPEYVADAASGLAGIGSAIVAANAAAAPTTTAVLAAGTDEVSAAIAAFFGSHGQGYQSLGAHAAAFHEQFMQALRAGGGAYATSEAANVEVTLLNAINAPTQALLGRPLFGNGTNAAPGSGADGGAAGI
ncbi:PE family protein, partial [Mycobacterium basiliense]